MFALVTLMACVMAWYAYSLNWIRERQQFLVHVDRSAEFRMHSPWIEMADGADVRGETWQTIDGKRYSRKKTSQALETPPAPGLLWMFGERGQPRLIVSVGREDPDALSDEAKARVEQARRLFPEARICIVYLSDGDALLGRYLDADH